MKIPEIAFLVALAAPWPATAAAPGAPPAGASATTSADKKAPAPLPPAAFPVPEIVSRAEEVAKRLQEFQLLAAPGPTVEAIQARLPELSAQLAREHESTIERLNQETARTAVDRLAQSWRANRLELAADVNILTKRAIQLESALGQLASLRASWTTTRAEARSSLAPAAVVLRADVVLTDIESTRAVLQAQRSATLVLQDQVAQEVARCQDVLARIAQFQQVTLKRTFVRDTLPVWSPELSGRYFDGLSSAASEAAAASVAVLRRFAKDHAGRIFFHVLLFIGLIFMARAAGRQAPGPAASADALPGAALFERPYSSAAVAALVAIFWIYPERPRLVGDVATFLALLPLLRIIRPLAGAAAAPGLYGLATLIVVDRFRAELAVVPSADQSILMLEMLAAIAGIAMLFLSGRLQRAPVSAWLAIRGFATRRATAVVALAACLSSFLAAAYGAMYLARMLGSGFIFGAFAALALYAAVQVTDGLLVFALRVRPLRNLGMVEHYRDLLARRAGIVIRLVAVAVWAVASLRNVGLMEPAAAFVRSVLDAELRRGSIGISLDDVLAFVITVWLAFLLSSFLRFVLEEDIYPRLRLARGLPYVISSLLHYIVLFLGFLLAVSALGVDLNKVTILAGAFGVGLGFGLQGLVNNFVSGLIVLFERPIHVGDSIQMGDVAGRVRRIGIRSTTVLTPEGAEVILPNASLVAEKVTNWTHSGQLRRLDVRVGVAYGSAPEKVLELLRGVAASHAGVIARPAPVALLMGFGDSALNFELRAWTNRADQWVEVRSELSVAVYAALRDAGMEIPFDHNFHQPAAPVERKG